MLCKLRLNCPGYAISSNVKFADVKLFNLAQLYVLLTSSLEFGPVRDLLQLESILKNTTRLPRVNFIMI